MDSANKLEIARRWANNDAIRTLARIEWANEAHGGVTPATVSSAVDSLAQAPDPAGFFSDDVVEHGRADAAISGLVALLQIADLVGTDVPLTDLVQG